MIDQPERVYQPISVKEWFLTLFLSVIPLVGIIMFFVWAFSADTHPSKKNWAKAGLIWTAIILVLYIIIFAVFGAALMSGAMGGNEFSRKLKIHCAAFSYSFLFFMQIKTP